MAIKVFIVDDESLARDELIYLLQSIGEIEVVGEANNGEQALEKIAEINPEVIFLDIQMPDMDGLTLAKKLHEAKNKAIIVFATAYDQHAVKAFEVNAIDYLLKPFDQERVERTVQRIKERLKQNNPVHENISQLIDQVIKEKQISTKGVSKLAVQGEDGVILLNPNEIVYAFRESRDVVIKTMDKTYPSRYTLQVLEEKLASYPFFRTHRSYLVNLHFIQEMVPWFNGAYNLILNDKQGSKVPVSRQYVKELRDILEL